MVGAQLDDAYPEFAVARERFLRDYCYNTARAYWSDLDDVLWWAHERGKDPLALTEDDFKAYLRLLKRRGYAASTVRRRGTAFRGLEISVGKAERRATGRQSE